MGAELEGLKSSFDKNDDGKITEEDINELSVLLSKEDTSKKKNELVEHLDYNLSEEDRKEISKLLREKLGLINGNITLTADEIGVNSYLYKTLIWVENKNLANDVLEEKATRKKAEFNKLSSTEKAKFLDKKFDKNNVYDESKIIEEIKRTRELLDVNFDKENIKGSLASLENAFNTIMTNNFDKIYFGDGSNQEKLGELNNMYDIINNFKEEHNAQIEEIRKLKEDNEKGKLTKIKETLKETHNPIHNAIDGFTLGAIQSIEGFSLSIDFKGLLETLKKEGLNILTLIWDGLVDEFKKKGKSLEKIFDGSIFEGARIIGKFLVDVLIAVISGGAIAAFAKTVLKVFSKFKNISKLIPKKIIGGVKNLAKEDGIIGKAKAAGKDNITQAAKKVANKVKDNIPHPSNNSDYGPQTIAA